MAAQAHGVRERTGLTVEQTDAAAWTVAEVDGDTVVVGGPQAIALHLAVAWQSTAPMLPFRVPGVGAVLDGVYGLIARNRRRLPGTTPWCIEHDGECEPAE